MKPLWTTILLIVFWNLLPYLQGVNFWRLDSHFFISKQFLTILKATDLYIVKVKQVKCSDIDAAYILNVTCKVRAERKKYGILDLCFRRLNVDHQMVLLKLWHQNSAGHFLPYLIDIQYNACDWGQLMKTGPKLFAVLQHVVQDGTDSDILVCPFNVSVRYVSKRINFSLIFRHFLCRTHTN